MTSTSIYHYVYRITNLVTGLHYYGVRSCKITPKLDLGIKYFSSSHNKQFMFEQKTYPKNFRYKIVRIYTNRREAVAFEIKLHIKFDVGANPNFYNQAKQTATGFDVTGAKHNIETINKIALYARDKTIHKMEHINGTVFIGTSHEFNLKHGLPLKDINKLKHGKQFSAKGWKLFGAKFERKNHSRDDIFEFLHIDGNFFRGTSGDFWKANNLDPSSVTKVVKGKNKSAEGWSLCEFE